MKIKAALLMVVLAVGLACSSASYGYEGSEDVTRAVQDVVITTKVKGVYFQDKLLNPFDIHVRTDDGDVYLSGVVDTNMQYEKAVALAQSVSGVTAVNANDLSVKEGQEPMTDAYITGKIEGMLLRDSIFRGDKANFWGVHVETKDSVVYLSGTVDSEKMKQHIIAVAQSVKEVKRVRNDLRIVIAKS